MGVRDDLESAKEYLANQMLMRMSKLSFFPTDFS